jgi:anti-sigma B factor antagonist
VVTYIRLRGLLGGTRESFEFLERIQQDAHRGSMRLIIDLKDVAHLASSGVGILASIYISLKNHDGHLCLIGVSGRIAAILRVVHLLDVLPHADSEDEALGIVGG